MADQDGNSDLKSLQGALTEKEQKKELSENERLKAKLYEMEQKNIRMEKDLEEAKAEKRKPGIPEILEDGKEIKKRRINSFGISDILLPPYRKNHIAVYRIIGTDEINPATLLPVEPVDTMIPGRYTLKDAFEKDPNKRKKTMKHLGVYSEDAIEKTQDWEDVPFPRGWKQVHIQDYYSLHVFLELHPLNKSNKYRPSNSAVVFERMDTQHSSPLVLGMMQNLMLEAGNFANKLSKDDVYAYAMGADPIIPTAGRQIHEIRTDVVKYAMASPMKFFRTTKNHKASIQINLYDAINFGVVEYNQDKKRFVLTPTDETLFTHTASEDPMESFVNHLAKEQNQPVYQAILDTYGHFKND
jgi:hypothetical protein